MELSDLSLGQLVHTNVEGPTFHRGALFKVISCNTNNFVACQAVGIAPFKLWYFRPQELEKTFTPTRQVSRHYYPNS